MTCIASLSRTLFIQSYVYLLFSMSSQNARGIFCCFSFICLLLLLEVTSWPDLYSSILYGGEYSISKGKNHCGQILLFCNFYIIIAPVILMWSGCISKTLFTARNLFIPAMKLVKIPKWFDPGIRNIRFVLKNTKAIMSTCGNVWSELFLKG